MMIGKIKALATGFIIGLLVAPRSGRDSRRLLVEWVEDFFATGTRRLRALEDELGRRREPLAETDWSVPEGGETLP
jgi:gas vesicle protein